MFSPLLGFISLFLLIFLYLHSEKNQFDQVGKLVSHGLLLFRLIFYLMFSQIIRRLDNFMLSILLTQFSWEISPYSLPHISFFASLKRNGKWSQWKSRILSFIIICCCRFYESNMTQILAIIEFPSSQMMLIFTMGEG